MGLVLPKGLGWEIKTIRLVLVIMLCLTWSVEKGDKFQCTKLSNTRRKKKRASKDLGLAIMRIKQSSWSRKRLPTKLELGQGLILWRRKPRLSNKIQELTTLLGAPPLKLQRNMGLELRRESISSKKILLSCQGLVIT